MLLGSLGSLFYQSSLLTQNISFENREVSEEMLKSDFFSENYKDIQFNSYDTLVTLEVIDGYAHEAEKVPEQDKDVFLKIFFDALLIKNKKEHCSPCFQVTPLHEKFFVRLEKTLLQYHNPDVKVHFFIPDFLYIYLSMIYCFLVQKLHYHHVPHANLLKLWDGTLHYLEKKDHSLIRSFIASIHTTSLYESVVLNKGLFREQVDNRLKKAFLKNENLTKDFLKRFPNFSKFFDDTFLHAFSPIHWDDFESPAYLGFQVCFDHLKKRSEEFFFEKSVGVRFRHFWRLVASINFNDPQKEDYINAIAFANLLREGSPIIDELLHATITPVANRKFKKKFKKALRLMLLYGVGQFFLASTPDDVEKIHLKLNVSKDDFLKTAQQLSASVGILRQHPDSKWVSQKLLGFIDDANACSVRQMQAIRRLFCQLQGCQEDSSFEKMLYLVLKNFRNDVMDHLSGFFINENGRMEHFGCVEPHLLRSYTELIGRQIGILSPDEPLSQDFFGNIPYASRLTKIQLSEFFVFFYSAQQLISFFKTQWKKINEQSQGFDPVVAHQARKIINEFIEQISQCHDLEGQPLDLHALIHADCPIEQMEFSEKGCGIVLCALGILKIKK